MPGYLTDKEFHGSVDILKQGYRPNIETSNPGLNGFLKGMQNTTGGGSIVDRYHDICQNPDALDLDGQPINTFPFGKPTRDVFNTFIGICGQGGDCISPGELFGAAAKYCKRLVEARFPDQSDVRFPDNYSRQEFAVYLFTDRWSKNAFMAYEPTFLYYAIHYRIAFRIFLVAGIGITEIPFLPYNLSELPDHYDLEEAELGWSEERYHELLDLQGDMPIFYKDGYEHYCGNGYKRDFYEYKINTRIMCSGYVDDYYKDRERERISEDDIQSHDVDFFISRYWYGYKSKLSTEQLEALIRAAAWISRRPNKEIKYQGYSYHAKWCELEIFGKHVSWPYRIDGRTPEERRFHELDEAFSKFYRDVLNEWSDIGYHLHE